MNWPSAPRGNRRAQRHGAYSSDVAERAGELADEILAVATHLSPDMDRPAVLRYATVLARIERAYSWLGDQDDDLFVDVETGELHAVLSRVERWESQAASAEARLAIAPASRARLGLLKAHTVDLAMLMAADAERERHELEEGDGDG